MQKVTRTPLFKFIMNVFWLFEMVVDITGMLLCKTESIFFVLLIIPAYIMFSLPYKIVCSIYWRCYWHYEGKRSMGNFEEGWEIIGIILGKQMEEEFTNNYLCKNLWWRNKKWWWHSDKYDYRTTLD